MRVQVDAAWHNETTCGIHDTVGTHSGNVGLERFDPAVANADVKFSAQPLAGVEHSTALDDQVELVGRTHASTGLGADDSGCKRCADTCHELPTIERDHGPCPK